ncbi:bacteriorhodopsin [Glaciihabitans sp. UYNi722]|uniref:bacteriorhodopsin n=1 Tax=Glaciihabitans sp. UYNi722 TaxID=3156344 RepID=UPI00339A10BA
MFPRPVYRVTTAGISSRSSPRKARNSVLIAATSAPWTAPLTESQHILTLYFLVIAGLALFAGFVRTWTTRSEVGSRFRPALVARLCVTAVASLSYVLLIVGFTLAYDHTGSTWVPNAGAIMTMAPRFMDWSVTVPLLTVELLAVCTLFGAGVRKAQFLAMAGSFLMIFTGFLGTFVFGADGDASQLYLWGAISSVFWIFVNVVLIRAVRKSLPVLTPESAGLLRDATILLLCGWVIYPLVYIIPIFAFGGGWTTTIQVTLCVADVLVKIGFGGLIHRVAKLRTAEDVRAGDDVHSEAIWISSVKQSDAGQPREIYLAEGAAVHPNRWRPPTSSAYASAIAAEDDSSTPIDSDENLGERRSH